jgi:spermidine/putrescine transport system substrate-binding protein
VTPGDGTRSRRDFLRGLGRTALGAAAGAGLTGLGSCAVTGLGSVRGIRAQADRSGSERMVLFANWPGYADESPGHPRWHPTLTEFSSETGISVRYSEPISGNEEFFGRIGTSLAVGEPSGYDLVVLSDWMLPQLIELGWAELLSPALIPGGARLLPRFRNWPVPDVRRYSLPWQAGFTGIAYNERVTGRRVTSMTDLLTSPDLRGRVSLVADMRDVMGLVMLDQGIDPGSFSHHDFNAALGTLARAVEAGQIHQVTNYYVADLAEGRVAAAIAWAGDVLFAQQHERRPYIRFTWPHGGGMLWTDNMVIPALARHRANAERLMNYYYRPDVAAQLSAYVYYLCPVQGTEAAIRRTDPWLAEQPFVFPAPALMDTGHLFKILTAQQSAAYTSAYQSVVGL